ncbi:hypothetical protein GCM10027296_21660 [Chitinimonas naiadis]
MADAVASRGGAQSYLAYEHTLELASEEEKLASLFAQAQALCKAAAADGCVILDSHIRTGSNAYASLKFRAKPGGVQNLIADLGKQGEVTGQSTTAEDLGGPIKDNARKLAMLQEYRAKLESLLAKSSADVDALIKLNKELAQVQSDVEALSGEQAHLMQRVDTEILNVNISTVGHRSFWSPIVEAGQSFGSSLSQGISMTITGIAYLLPWFIALILVVWAGRKLWRRRKP